jgi:twitching motility protein PilT
MNVQPSIRALIREDKVHQIESMIEIGQKFGMNTMNMRLADLVMSKQIDRLMAIQKSNNPENLEKILIERELKRGQP